MAIETTAILRSILYSLLKAQAANETLAEGIDAVKVMCSKDDISAAEQQLNEYLKRQKNSS
jgi:hypothetical protein